MRTVMLAATQFACTWDLPGNADRAEALVRAAAAQGAKVILIQELFATPYFCVTQRPEHFDLARPIDGHPLVARFADLARELGVVLPVSVFERAGTAFFNSVAMIDADGRRLGVYRKSHIPQGPGYEEKFYFSPGDTGLRVWDTAAGRIGVGICWDQWFPEAARAMALMGAEMILYPTAIGSEPPQPGYDSQPHWETVMRGHAAANILPVVAALERVPGSVIEASGDLGADPGQTFRKVIFPLAFPGVVAGSILTFSLTLGDYIIPGIIGSSTPFLGQAVYSQQGVAGNIPLAAAFTVVPIVIMGIYLTLAKRLGAFDAI